MTIPRRPRTLPLAVRTRLPQANIRDAYIYTFRCVKRPDIRNRSRSPGCYSLHEGILPEDLAKRFLYMLVKEHNFDLLPYFIETKYRLVSSASIQTHTFYSTQRIIC